MFCSFLKHFYECVVLQYWHNLAVFRLLFYSIHLLGKYLQGGVGPLQTSANSSTAV